MLLIYHFCKPIIVTFDNHVFLHPRFTPFIVDIFELTQCVYMSDEQTSVSLKVYLNLITPSKTPLIFKIEMGFL